MEAVEIETDIAELSKKYKSPLQPQFMSMIELACVFCRVKCNGLTQFQTRLYDPQNSFVCCEDCKEKGKEGNMLYTASQACFPAESLRDIKIKYKDAEWELVQLRISQSLNPNTLRLLCCKGGYESNRSCETHLEKNREVFEKIRDIVRDYEDPYYPKEMQKAFCAKLEALLVRESCETRDNAVKSNT